MGNKQSIKVIGPQDLLETRNPCADIRMEDLMKYYNAIMAGMPKRKNVWDYLDASSFLNEPTTKPSKEQSSLNWKSALYAMQYATAPRKLTENLSLAAIASGSTSDGTPPKDKQNGTKSEKE